ncbi:hypothetical protein KJ966_02160 [bacterium]|nr:hypothetical protein [bacterium]
MNTAIRLALILIVALCHTGVFAGPTIIRDKRISDLAMTPTLGRGYTIVTNTFQSKCLDNIVITDPSYDFTYKFESMTSNNIKHLSTMVNFGLKIPIKAVSISAGGGASTTMTSQETSHHIFVEINMDTYYASIDEARSRLGSSSAQLLRNNDIPGFFSACGSYYVRSLGRNARFVSVYTYTTKTQKRDVAFEANLKAEVGAFATAGVGDAACGASGGCPGSGGQGTVGGPDPNLGGNVTSADSFVGASSTSTGGAKVDGMAGGAGGMKMNMKSLSEEYKLSILTRAYGLGKNEGATLISYDVPTFKAAIKDAFISMQNPMTGKVTTMEIVPWVENTEFQSLIALEKDVPDPLTGRTMLLYKKKQILNGNAEFLAEIERADRAMMNIYYKAKICKQTIQANWLTGTETIKPEYKDLEIGNNRFPIKKIKLDALLKEHLTEPKIEELIKKEETFMYGSNGANICIMKMLDSGMYIKSYRDIDECKQLRGKLSAVINDVIDEYCMPEVARIIETDQPDGGLAPANSPIAPQ